MKKFIIFLILISATSVTFSQTVKFAAIGDYGGFTENGGAGELAVANMVKSWDTDTSFFIITLGDNNYYPTVEADQTIDRNIGQFYHNYIYPYNQAGFSPGYSPNPQTVNRFFPAMGNHDHYGNPVYSYYLYFRFTNINLGNSVSYPGGIRYYDFRKGNVHFFCLNSGVDPADHSGYNFYSEPDGIDSNSVQGQWLKTRLAQSDAKWKIVYFHHPPYFSIYGYPTDSYKAMRYPFKRWGANVVLCGHLHTYEKLYIDGMTYITNGLGGDSDGLDSLYQPAVPGSLVRYSANFGALKGAAYADSLVFRFINIDGQVVDYSRITENGLGPPPTKLYVNDNSLSGNIYTTAAGNDFNSGAPGSPFATISHAILVAEAGDTIMVDAGNYSENINVNKSLVISGTNKNNTGYSDRISESQIISNGNHNAVITVTAGNVILEGLTINGDDPNISGSPNATGNDVNANSGIIVSGSYNGVIVRNNIIKNVFTGFNGEGLSAGNLITGNLFNGIGNFNKGSAISLQNNHYADITNNKMTGVWTGIFINNFNSGSGVANWNVTGNEIHSFSAGICYRYQKQNAASINFNNNRISAETAAVDNNFGILIISVKDSVNPIFTNNIISGTDYGIGLFDVTILNGLNLGNSDTVKFTKKSGILFTNELNFNPVDTTNFLSEGPGGPSKLNISGTVLLPYSGTGITADAGGGTNTELNINSLTHIEGGTTGLHINGAASVISGNSLNNLSFTGQTGKYISLTHNALKGNITDATGALFDGTSGAVKNALQNYQTEDKIDHGTDKDSLGIILVKSGNLFITQNSFVLPETSSPSVQRGINAASDGFTLNIAGGLYNEDLDINKRIEIAGDNSGTVIRGLYGGNENTIKVTSDNASIRNLTVTRDYGADITSWQTSTKKNGIYLSPNTSGINIDNVNIHGNRNGIFIDNSQSSEITNCRIDSNYNGVIYINNTDSSIMSGCFIKYNFATGVKFDFDEGELSSKNSEISNNNISHNWYSQVNFKRDIAPGINPGNLAGLKMSCNWYGTDLPVIISSPSDEPGYETLIPVQFGGTDPGLNRSLYGMESTVIPYTPWLVSGKDTDSLLAGFQPEDSCTGISTIHKIYVNDSSSSGDVYTSAAGNDNNSGLSNSPFASIQHAVMTAVSGDTIIIDAGTYNEDILIDKKLNITGASGLTFISGLYSGDSATVLITSDSTELKNVAVTRDFGNDLISWQNCTKNYGIILSEGTSNISLINVIVRGNRNGILVSGSQNLVIENCLIKKNYSGLTFAGNVSGAQIHNNFINENFTNGVLFEFDQTPGMVLTNVQFSLNNISDNWYSQVNFKHENINVPAGDTSGFTFNCNWYGKELPSSSGINEELPDYSVLIPTQFEGTSPGLDRQLYGSGISFCKFHPWLTNGNDNDNSIPGFQEIPGSCNGLQTAFYVNDTNTTGDYYTSDKGSDFNSGTPDAPFSSIGAALSAAGYGDTIFADAGSYNESLIIDRKIFLLGANAGISPNFEIRRTESNLTGENSISITGTDNVIIKGFRFTSNAGHPLNADISGADILFEKNILEGSQGIFFSEPDTLKITDNKFMYLDSVFESGIVINGNYNGNEGTYSEISKNIWRNCNSGGMHISNVRGSINFNDFNFILNYGIMIDSAFSLNITKNSFNGIICNETNSSSPGSGILFTSVNSGSDANISENFFTQNKKGITVQNLCNLTGSVISINNNSFLENTGDNIENFASGIIAASCNWYGTTDVNLISVKLSNRVNFFPYLTAGTDADEITPGFQPEADVCNGHNSSMYVNDNSNDVRVYTSANGNDANPGTSSAPLSTIKKAISLAQPNDTIYVDAGIYSGNDTINKPITLIGAGNDLTIIYPGYSNPDPDGAGNEALYPEASNIFLIRSNNVTIRKINLDGDNTMLNSGVSINGADIDARNGIVTDNVTGIINGLFIDSVKVKNIFLKGITNTTGGSFKFSNITADNILGNAHSYAISNTGGSGFYINNIISNSTQAIVSILGHHSLYSGNHITSSGTGIHTIYSGNGTGESDTICGNSIENSLLNGNGIFIYSPFSSAIIKDNIIKNTDKGFLNAGQSDSAIITFTQNTVDGQNRSGSRGVVQTTIREGESDTDVKGIYTNNFIKNNSIGFTMESDSGSINNISSNDNFFSGNTEIIQITGNVIPLNNFSCNWWGTATDVNSLVIPSVNFTPYLTDSTDNEPETAGFQALPGSCNGNPPTELIVKIIPEGLYNVNTKTLALKDTVKAYLHNNTSPFDVIDSAVSIIDSNTFNASFDFPQVPDGTYYIEITHRNSLSTWSTEGGMSFTAHTIMHYDFTTSRDKAFGNNLTQVDSEPVLYGIFGGDVNQEGVIDLTDLIIIHNDESNFVTGYVNTDINGDYITDLNDIILTYNNSANFAEKIIP